MERSTPRSQPAVERADRTTPRSQAAIDRADLAVSSRWTPFYKFFIPLVTFGMIAYGDHAVWVAQHSVIRNTLPEILSADALPLLLALEAAVVLLVLWMAIPLKRVVLTKTSLRVSNYITEITVPLSDVDEVGHLGWTPPRRARIWFRVSTGFGKSVTVIPPIQLTLQVRTGSPALEKVRRAVLFY